MLQSMELQKIRHNLTNEQQEQPHGSSYLAISIVNGRNYLRLIWRLLVSYFDRFEGQGLIL